MFAEIYWRPQIENRNVKIVTSDLMVKIVLTVLFTFPVMHLIQGIKKIREGGFNDFMTHHKRAKCIEVVDAS